MGQTLDSTQIILECAALEISIRVTQKLGKMCWVEIIDYYTAPKSNTNQICEILLPFQLWKRVLFDNLDRIQVYKLSLRAYLI